MRDCGDMGTSHFKQCSLTLNETKCLPQLGRLESNCNSVYFRDKLARILCQNNRFMEVYFGGMCGNPAYACLTKKVYHCERFKVFKLEIKLRRFTVLLMLQLNEVKFMHYNFKGKFYALIFSFFLVSFGLLYKVNVLDTTRLITMAVNSSCSHKLAILSFT